MAKIKVTKLDLHLGGRPRVWKWNYNAIAELSEVRSASGRAIESGLSQLRAILWAGLLWQDPALTLEQVGEWIDGADMDELSDKLMGALKEAQPDEPENPTNPTMASAA